MRGQLPMPVVLPQRRPKMNTRGFVRAYAPVLMECDIDQTMWMDFLNGFHKAIKMSPVFHATNGAIAAGAVALQVAAGPSIAIHLAALAIHLSVEASRRGYTQYQTNKYIDAMNEELFKPRGLYAMIMTYKPDSTSASQTIDLNSNISNSINTRIDGHGPKFSTSSGKSFGELQLPAAAPLVFPDLDAMPASETDSKTKKDSFLSEYFDRRAQAKFEAQNPNSSLSVAPRKEFASRYSDPNHPASSGSPISLITGGKVPGRKELRRRMMNGGKSGGAGAVASGPRGLKKYLAENVLYLMVVNLPTPEEMREVEAGLEAAQR